ncbi:sensor histidine kinase [Paenibacillus albicereus]|uniref:Sensor histidine kinase n=1 Tax=Paenibacillus albicereus TaxID=2726185 RepID=A0A6H2GVF5_9BACL|nr:sensor histidine kinase [Paenibacillus albicereus]QJC51411.1 sensor histidine kinase [Paenibacillus albicereus]
MLNPLTRLSVRLQLILLFLFMALPILGLFAYGNMKAETIMKDNVTGAYAELNKQNLLMINKEMDGINRITTTIIQNPVTQRIVPGRREPVLDRVKKYAEMDKLLRAYSTGTDGETPVYYSLYVYDPTDEFYFAPSIQMTNNGVYFLTSRTKPAWFEKAVRLKGVGFVEMTATNTAFDKSPTLAYIRAVNNIGEGSGVIGVLVAYQLEHKIADTMRSVNLPGGDISLVDEAGTVMSSTLPDRLGTRLELPAVLAERVAQARSDLPFHLIEGDWIYVASGKNSLHLRLIYEIPVQAMLQQQSELKNVILLISAVYVAVGCIVMIYFWRSLMTPLQRLSLFVRKYEPGKLVPETPGQSRRDEVGVLISAVYGMARRLNSLIADKYQADIRQKEAQLQILYHQINPHLLYNTLESIYWKSSLEGHSESAEMIKDLSKLMKISLSRGRELITLAEESEHAAAYVALQRRRYEAELRVLWDIPEELGAALIPKITLQPLIENAIIHGIKHMGEDGEIVVAARAAEGGDLLVTVGDNGYKSVDYAAIQRWLAEPDRSPSIGYGIRNIDQRIRLQFGPRYGLGIGPREGGGTEVRLLLPLLDDASNPGQPRGE